MSEWKEYRLGDIALSSDFVANGSFASLKENVKYLDSENYAILIRLYDFHNNWKGPFVYVDEGSFNFLKKSNVEPGDLIIANVGANAGESFLAPPLKKSMTLGPNSILIKGSNCKYLFYYFNSTYGKWQLDSIITGSAQPKFNKTDLRNLKVKLPSETKQGLIVEILSSLDDKIELNNKINQELETLAQTLFKQWFIDIEFPNENGESYKSSGGEMVESELGEIPKGWRVGQLNEIAILDKGNIKPFENPTEQYNHYSLPDFDNGKKPSITYGNEILSSKYRVTPYSLLISKLNPRIPRTWVITECEENSICSTEFQVIKPKSLEYFSFICTLCSSNIFFDSLKSKVTGTSSSHQRVNPADIINYKFTIPQNDILVRFDSAISNIFIKINNNLIENNSLIATRDTLLTKLISGELEINELPN